MVMKSPPQFSPFCARRGYHHGRLRDALLAAARHLIAERGPFGFTLAEAAKMAGVTPAAPYRHFPDRNAVLQELRREGFRLFHERLSAAWDGGRPDPMTALGRMGEAYQNFARSEPGLYAAMFQSNLATEDAAEPDSLKLLEHAAAAVLVRLGASPVQAPALALQIWALSHGVATLALAGQLDPKVCGGEPDRIVNSAVAALFASATRA